MNMLKDISYLLGLAANYTIIVILFRDLFRKKSGWIVLGVGFVLMTITRMVLIEQFSMPLYYASAMGIVVPCALLCFFLSKYHDGRFFFTYFLSLNIYLIIRILASIAALMPASAMIGVWVELLVKLSLLGAFAALLKKNTTLFKDALSEDAAWNALGVVSILSTVLLIKLIADLDKFSNRAEFYPELLLYCLLLSAAYFIVIRVIKIQTDKKRLIANALKASEEAGLTKMTFLSRMSHEIRTPLNAIIGLSELDRANLESAQPSREDGLDYVTKILDSSHYLLALINDILDMSKMETSEIKLTPQVMNCAQILSSIQTIIETQAKAKHICFRIERLSNCPDHVMGDATRVKQVLINLLNNAVKFTPEGGEVRLSIEQLSKTNQKITMCFRVTDTGVGISPEFFPRMFEPFAQEYSGATSSYGGSGLGLSIARKLTRMMNGDLTAESKKGKGSVFTAVMEFEIVDEKNVKEPVSDIKHHEQIDLQNLKILVCEDHPLNIMVIKRLLEQKGWKKTNDDHYKRKKLFQNHIIDRSYSGVPFDCRCLVAVSWRIPRQLFEQCEKRERSAY